MTTTKTAPATDPVAEAQNKNAEAQTAELDARQRCDDLRAAVLRGEDVTPEHLAEAGHALEHAQLGAEAARLALEGAQRQARLDRLDVLREDIRAGAGSPAEAAEAMALIEEGAARLVALCATRRQSITRWVAALRREQVPRYDPNGKVRTDAQGRRTVPYKELSAEHGHMGWREAAMGFTDTVYVSGRSITPISAAELTAAALDRGCRRAGHHPALLGNVSAGSANPDLARDPRVWLDARF